MRHTVQDNMADNGGGDDDFGNQTASNGDGAEGLSETICSCGVGVGDGDGDGDGGFWSGLDVYDGDVLAVFLGIVTLIGSVIAYFYLRNVDRKEATEAERQRLDDLDCQQALDRVRLQLSVYVGPLHRLYKTQNSMIMQYMQDNKVRLKVEIWSLLFNPDYLEPFIENPRSQRAVRYRKFIEFRMKPIYEQIRELHLNHSSDLADMPSQEEYLEKWTEDHALSPYIGSIDVDVIFDSYTVWAYEFDDIIAAWNEDGDFSRMQPTTRVAWPICNYIVDYLAINAKKKEAGYNKHVKVHDNKRQSETDGYELVRSAHSAAGINNDDNNNKNNDDDDDVERDTPTTMMTSRFNRGISKRVSLVNRRASTRNLKKIPNSRKI